MSDDRARWEERYAGGLTMDHRPSAFLVTQADRIAGRVLDVGAGAGRNALFLARRGCTVEAIDLSLTGLRAAVAAARAEGLRVLAVQADLEEFPLPTNRYDAAINIRYLQRSLLAPLQSAVKPGGIILFETFLIDQQALGHPRNPAHLLRHGELREAFRRWEVLAYEEGLFEDGTGSAYVARMVASRPRGVESGIEFSEGL